MCCKCNVHTGFQRLSTKIKRMKVPHSFFVLCVEMLIFGYNGLNKIIIKINFTCFFLLYVACILFLWTTLLGTRVHDSFLKC